MHLDLQKGMWMYRPAIISGTKIAKLMQIAARKDKKMIKRGRSVEKMKLRDCSSQLFFLPCGRFRPEMP
jgi:hypothetical protein